MNATTKLIAALLLSGTAALASANSEVNRDRSDQEIATHSASGLTRAQVRADFLAARAAGELIEGENRETARELNPALYPVKATVAPARSRTEVRQEAVAAARSGERSVDYYGN